MRFSCECLDPTHTIDLSVEIDGEGKIFQIDFCEQHISCQLPMLLRIKRAFKVLFGMEIWNHGFIIREEDVDDMLKILEKAK